MYWNPNKTLSYNKLFNFIVGSRGGGKSFGAKDLCIRRFLKKQSQFVYMRRYENELKLNTDLWRDIKKFYPDTEFRQKGGNYYIDNQLAGNSFALSTSDKYKSVSYEGTEIIIFDEFMVDNNRSGYLPKEVLKFLDAYETIARTRDVRVFFISNALTEMNPYFTYFNVKLPNKPGFNIYDDILVERVEDGDYIAFKEQTRFGKIIANTEYFEYAVKNEYLLDSSTFIERKTGNCQCKAVIRSTLGEFGVWQNEEYICYISEDTAKTWVVISVDMNAHKEGTQTIKSELGRSFWSWLVERYNKGLVRFENQKCKQMFCEVYGRALT